MNNTIKLTNKNKYLNDRFQKDKTDRSTREAVLTGLKYFDEKLPIRNGVYLIGGLPSVGKTSLMLQFADTFAEQGNHVLFFSLEQSEYDLTVKSVNRIVSKELINEAAALEKYSAFAENITTATSECAVTVEEIVSVAEEFMNNTNSKPIIFIDYLQLLHTNKPLGKREEIEEVSRQLVSFSKKYKLTMFIISSLNRANYISPIDFESFKESGSLEYDADVVLGLQYQLLSDPSFINMSSIDKKRLLVGQEKIKEIRQVEISCIKNRFGQIFESCKLDYITNADLFVEHKSDRQSSKRPVKVL